MLKEDLPQLVQAMNLKDLTCKCPCRRMVSQKIPRPCQSSHRRYVMVYVQQG